LELREAGAGGGGVAGAARVSGSGSAALAAGSFGVDAHSDVVNNVNKPECGDAGVCDGMCSASSNFSAMAVDLRRGWRGCGWCWGCWRC